jgi:hypothetical protein
MPTIGQTGGVVRVTGLRETIKQLEALGASKQEIVDANFQAAETLRKAALPYVPLYQGNRGANGVLYQYKTPGSLRSSLRSSKAKGYAQVLMGNSRVVYANPIHWGWFYDKEWFIQKNIKPNLFLYRALSQQLNKIVADYNRDMQNLIDKYGLGAK